MTADEHPTLLEPQTGRAGTTLGNYHIVRLLGVGGMGEVYLADDPSLGRQVALKVLPRTFAIDDDRMRRFVREARSAAALNHPHIAHIYEIGEDSGEHYIAMELVSGETLRRKLARSVIPPSEVFRYLIQVTDALTKAHQNGIVHRDLKPDNIMISTDGYAKVLDFGLAKVVADRTAGAESATRALPLTSSGMVMGTANYMSPEQARGLSVDTRSDIWSMGVILYEALTRTLPFDGETNTDTLVSILQREPPPLEGSNAAFQGIIDRCLAKEREGRYSSAAELASDLRAARDGGGSFPTGQRDLTSDSNVPVIQPAPSHRRDFGLLRRVTGSLPLIACILLFAGVAVGTYFFLLRPGKISLNEKDTVVLADFVNNTGDPTFDGTMLKQALAIQLNQTPFLNLLPEEGIRETLRYMGRPADEKLTNAVAREVCVRRGLRAMIVGTIAALGNSYVITLDALNGQTGASIASQQIQADGKEQVLKALGQAALELRRQLGESLQTLQKYDAPIEEATTSSLDALNIYSKGLEQIYSGHSREALPLFNKAVEIDPNFAEAYVWISWTYANLGDFEQTGKFAEKAHSLRDRVTEHEKLRLDDIYHLWATGDVDRLNETDELLTKLYPKDWVAYNSQAIVTYWFGNLDKSVTAAQAAIEANPNEVHPYWHGAGSLLRAGRFDEARQMIADGRSKQLDHPAYRRILILTTLATGDRSTAKRLIDESRSVEGEGSAVAYEIRLALADGRWRDAQTLARPAIESARQKPNGPPPLGGLLEVSASLFGICPTTEDSIRSASITLTQPRFIMYVPIKPDASPCMDSSQVAQIADEHLKRYPVSTSSRVYAQPILHALAAMKRGQYQEAIDSLELTRPYESGDSLYWADYIRGQAYLRLGQGTDAAKEFQTILNHPAWDPFSPVYALSRLGLARSLAVTRDMDGSRKAYQQFLDTWSHADTDLPVMQVARREFQQLG